MHKYLLTFSILFLAKLANKQSNNLEECVSVPPGGVSGFWYSMAKLKDYKNNDYYCASSGCLAVVSSKINAIDVYNFAKMSRDNYSTFSDIKNNFIDLLVKKIKFNPDIIISTMTKYGTCVDRRPLNKKQLKSLLIKTTDVPFLVNNINGEIDGGLCYYYMNNCKYNIIFPFTYKFVSNLFNYDMTDSEIIYFYTFS